MLFERCNLLGGEKITDWSDGHGGGILPATRTHSGVAHEVVQRPARDSEQIADCLSGVVHASYYMQSCQGLSSAMKK